MDLNDLKQKYSVDKEIPPDKKKAEEKPKFGKRRDWIEDSSTINRPKEDFKTIDNIENKYILYIDSTENNDLNKNINNFSIENKLENKYLKSIDANKEAFTPFERIAGLQKQALLLIYEHCQLIGSRITRPLGVAYFVERLSTSQLNAHNVLNELVKKNVIRRSDFQRGRGGWTKWEIIEASWNEIGLNNLSIVLNDRKYIEQTIETPLSSSNGLNLEKNTNTEAEAINFEIPEVLRSIGIGNRQLIVIVRDKFLSVIEVQESLQHYAHDVSKNLVKKSNNFFFGVLRNKTPYISSNFAQDEAKLIQEEIARIKKIQAQRAEFKELKSREQYEQFLIENPNWIEDLKRENSFLAKLPADVFERAGFDKWKEKFSK